MLLSCVSYCLPAHQKAGNGHHYELNDHAAWTAESRQKNPATSKKTKELSLLKRHTKRGLCR